MTEAQGDEVIARLGTLLDHVVWVDSWLQAALAVGIVAVGLLLLIAVGNLWRSIQG